MEARTVHQLTHGYNTQVGGAIVISPIGSSSLKSSLLDLK